MKRSEMVDKLQSFVFDATDCAYRITEEEASLLLQFIEKAGMLPPPDNTDVINSNLVYCYYIDKTYEGHERVFEIEDSYGKLDYSRSKLWEPEDE